MVLGNDIVLVNETKGDELELWRSNGKFNVYRKCSIT